MSVAKRSAKRQPKRGQSSENEKAFAMYVAMVIRNALEDFHVEHLSDRQMRELNPIIRNAIYTALHAFREYEISPAAKQFASFHLQMIPGYWEQPELLEDYQKLKKSFEE